MECHGCPSEHLPTFVDHRLNKQVKFAPEVDRVTDAKPEERTVNRLYITQALDKYGPWRDVTRDTLD